ncbi:ATP-dependent DNA helicase PIF1-like protein [Tanacetum coccineum]
MILLAVASSGFASLLLPGERTAHSRIVIPLKLMENSTSLDKTLRDILGYQSSKKRNRIFGGVTVLLGGDFRQILPFIPKGKRLEIIKETFHDFTTGKSEDDYLKERAILTAQNDDADAINAYMFQKLSGASVTYDSSDEVCKASTDTLDQQHLYPHRVPKFLKFLRDATACPVLKKGTPHNAHT